VQSNENNAAGRLQQSTPAPPDLLLLIRAGRALQEQGRLAEAIAVFKQALLTYNDSAELHNNLGNAYQEAGRQDLARGAYEDAIAADDTFVPALQNLGYMLVNFGLLDEGLEHLRRAQALRPRPINQVMLATSLPVIYHSVDDLRQRRETLEASVRQLVDEGVTLDVTATTAPTNFFAAYQGFNDCELQRNLCRVYQAPQPVEPRPRGDRGDRIRVGFLSSHFCNHTIGRLNLGRVQQLDRQRFEVTVIASGHHSDEVATAFRQCADRFVALSHRIDQARQQIASLPLDVLVFADVGMNTLTYTLAMSRMAPVQCVTWGHPVTTGSPAIDYFISSQWLETAEADDHYTERLIRLANLGTYYYCPRLTSPPRTRESFGLDSARHVYLCPQTLFKIHPEFDAYLGEILRRDPKGDLVLLAGRQPQWTQLLRERFERTMPDVASRVRFLPGLPYQEFLQLNAAADVLLDPIHFGGGNTSYEGLAVGTPIVTQPGPYLRSRITLALYRKMNLTDCVAAAFEHYVDLSVRLGSDPEFRAAVSEKILEACPVLYEDRQESDEIERFLVWAAAERPGAWSVAAPR
jgi:predicted O-linked N-acetylglucosamine transferase (SPINDLY family)